ncbi:uncharacterized protein VP01_950g8 [Puccinia sorghi]|uniref:Uncharacterized protein n=1 Tax=Puccinia sorghi TaxID=27349 RepID=A0A0L6U6Z1_9BASI|nr:uncharacterized protein VP01_950g8 [Puccinia sorghi]
MADYQVQPDQQSANKPIMLELDTSSNKLVTEKLDVDNFSVWRWGIITALGYKNLDNYVLAKHTADMVASADYKQRKKEPSEGLLKRQTEGVTKIAESSQALVVSQFPGATNNGTSSGKKKGKRLGCQNGCHNPEAQHTEEECWHLHPEKCVAFHEAALERVKARFGGPKSLSSK